MSLRPYIDAITHPLRRFGRLRDIWSAVGTEFVVMASSFLTLRFAAAHWGAEGFGEFVLFRRNIGLLQLPLSLSLGLGVTRFVAVARASGGSERAYGAASILVSTGSLMILLLTFLLMPARLAEALFGNSAYAGLLGGLVCAVSAAVLHALAYGIFRGQQDVFRANLLQVVAVGGVPLMVLSVGDGTVVQSAYAIGLLWGLVSVVAIFFGMRQSSGGTNGGNIREAVRSLLGYGLPRVPGEFALSAIFALPVIVTAQRGGVEPAGQLGFGITLVSLASSGFAPIGMFVLPQVASRLARGEVAGVRGDVAKLLGICIGIAISGTLALWLLAPAIVTLGLGKDFAEAVPVVRLALFAVVPYVVYVVLRSVLDAASPWPHNARNLVLSVGCFVGLIAVVPGTHAVTVAMNISVLILAALSLVDVWRVLPGSGAEPVA